METCGSSASGTVGGRFGWTAVARPQVQWVGTVGRPQGQWVGPVVRPQVQWEGAVDG